MRVYGFTEESAGIMEVENSLRAEQDFVGGHIEVLKIAEGLDIVCNDDGKINGLPMTAAWFDRGELVEIICGNCFVCRYTAEGEFASVLDSDIEIIKKILIPVDNKTGRLRKQ